MLLGAQDVILPTFPQAKSEYFLQGQLRPGVGWLTYHVAHGTRPCDLFPLQTLVMTQTCFAEQIRFLIAKGNATKTVH